MKTLTYFFISTIIICSLSSCSNKEIKPIKVKFYTFGNDVQYNRNYPTDIQNIVQPYEEYYFSQITFEDKVNGWKGSIDLVDFSQLNPGFNLSSNINASKNLIKRYFNSSDNRKNPKNSHILYKNANVNLKSSNIPEFINSLKRNSNNAVLVYTEDDNISGRNIYHDEESLRNAILSNYKNKKQIIIIYKPGKGHLSIIKPRPIPPDNHEDKKKKLATTVNPTNKEKDEKGKKGVINYPSITSKTLALEAKETSISWKSIKYSTKEKTIINYKIDYFMYGENQPFYSTTTQETNINYKACDKCMKLPEGSVITINVSLQTASDKYTTIAACDLAPINRSLANCHCPLYGINK